MEKNWGMICAGLLIVIMLTISITSILDANRRSRETDRYLKNSEHERKVKEKKYQIMLNDIESHNQIKELLIDIRELGLYNAGFKSETYGIKEGYDGEGRKTK